MWDLKHVKRWQMRGRGDGGKEVDDEVRRGKGLVMAAWLGGGSLTLRESMDSETDDSGGRTTSK